MNWQKEFTNNKLLKDKISDFLDIHGVSGLEQALQLYTDMHQEYLIKNKSSISKIKINDIYYLDIQGHDIILHTASGLYKKYGTLNEELETLSHYGFIKCSQSCMISLSKIKTIHNNEITLTNDDTVHMSKRFAPKVLLAYSVGSNTRKFAKERHISG
ncbi:MAG: LytTR family DNA-binding domain-containing protein [Lachnospiraceae bacterium]|nr:LytTR family DNA-binding domain-containing protein [Lachnospiraceae bacterium]